MVTMPSEAAHDADLVRELVANGMDCMRIDCAHDDAEAWAGILANLQHAKQQLGRGCRVLMDVAGPKLRTGSIDPYSQVVKWSPQRDLDGRVTAPVRVWLTAAEAPEPPPIPAGGSLQLPAALLAQLRSGHRVQFTDLRGKSRVLDLGDAQAQGRWALSTQTVYLSAGTPLPVTCNAKGPASAKISAPASWRSIDQMRS